MIHNRQITASAKYRFSRINSNFKRQFMDEIRSWPNSSKSFQLLAKSTSQNPANGLAHPCCNRHLLIILEKLKKKSLRSHTTKRFSGFGGISPIVSKNAVQTLHQFSVIFFKHYTVPATHCRSSSLEFRGEPQVIALSTLKEIDTVLHAGLLPKPVCCGIP